MIDNPGGDAAPDRPEADEPSFLGLAGVPEHLRQSYFFVFFLMPIAWPLRPRRVRAFVRVR